MRRRAMRSASAARARNPTSPSPYPWPGSFRRSILCLPGRNQQRRTRKASGGLLDLRFLELDVLARDRVVLAEAHLLGLVPRVLLGHIEEARVGRADELDLDGCRLGHRAYPKCLKRRERRFEAARSLAQMAGVAEIVKVTRARNRPLTLIGEFTFNGTLARPRPQATR